MTVETQTIQAFEAWLGREAVDPSRGATYVRLFLEISCIDSGTTSDSMLAAFDEVKSIADGFARAQLRAPSQPAPSFQPVLSRGRQHPSGLRRGTMGTALTLLGKRHGRPLQASSEGAAVDGPLAYLRMGDDAAGLAAAPDFVEYLSLSGILRRRVS